MDKLRIGRNMKKQFSVLLILIVFIFSSASCAALSDPGRNEYGKLGSAVSAAAYVVIGEYGDSIPADFNAGKFLILIEKKIPDDYFNILKEYPIELKPKGSYYLLLIFDSKTKSLILFDYSCTPGTDGLILRHPGRYDINNLEMYDSCKTVSEIKN